MRFIAHTSLRGRQLATCTTAVEPLPEKTHTHVFRIKNLICGQFNEITLIEKLDKIV